jgi:cysteine desulfurase
MTERVYLDWNATAPPHPSVVRAITLALEDNWGNPASVHAPGRKARAVVDDVREALAALFGAHPRDVIFTSGGTEANNLALAGAPGVALSRIEHPSVVRAAERVAAQGASLRWVDVRADGVVDLDAARRALSELPRGSVLAVMAANHETGVLQPVAQAAELARTCQARLHVDAVQVLGKWDLAELRDCDSVALSAHKIRGPKGLGALIWRRNPTELRPVLVGGSQERGLRAGTLDPAAAAGFAAALAEIQGGVERFAAVAELRDALEQRLARFGLVNGQGTLRLPHVSNISFSGRRGDELVAALDLMGVAVSAGSACSAGSQEASPVITAMLGTERAEHAVRISMGDVTTRAEIERAIGAFERALTRD